jgi:hypothetical protein
MNDSSSIDATQTDDVNKFNNLQVQNVVGNISQQQFIQNIDQYSNRTIASFPNGMRQKYNFRWSLYWTYVSASSTGTLTVPVKTASGFVQSPAVLPYGSGFHPIDLLYDFASVQSGLTLTYMTPPSLPFPTYASNYFAVTTPDIIGGGLYMVNIQITVNNSTSASTVFNVGFGDVTLYPYMRMIRMNATSSLSQLSWSGLIYLGSDWRIGLFATATTNSYNITNFSFSGYRVSAEY